MVSTARLPPPDQPTIPTFVVCDLDIARVRLDRLVVDRANLPGCKGQYISERSEHGVILAFDFLTH
jgi:hypothetical protein